MIRRRSSILVAALLLLALAVPASAGREPGTSWKTETDSPVVTQTGTWTEADDGRSATLDLAGGHTAGTHTRFVAKWLTPWTPSDEQPHFTDEWSMENFNQLGEEVTITFYLRFRDKGKPWSGWLKHPIEVDAGTWGARGGGGEFTGYETRAVQFEWKLVGDIEGPTLLDATFDLAIN